MPIGQGRGVVVRVSSRAGVEKRVGRVVEVKDGRADRAGSELDKF